MPDRIVVRWCEFCRTFRYFRYVGECGNGYEYECPVCGEAHLLPPDYRPFTK